MNRKLYTLLFFISLILFSCKSAEKLYNQGRYEEAVSLAAKKLSKKPNDASMQEILQNAYRYAVDDHENRIRNFSNTTSELRFENIYREYTSLQRLYEIIRRTPSVYEKVQPTDYSSYIQTYKEEAGNARLDRGDELMAGNTKMGAREAYYEFQKALALKPGDLSIKQKIDEAYANAVTNVVIMPLSRFGYQYSSYNFDYGNFDYTMVNTLNNTRSNNFIQFYSGPDAERMNVRPDNFVDMKFSDVNIGRYRDQRNTREVTRQVVSKEIVHKPDSVTKEYITVKAKITTVTRTLQADGLLQATVRDINNKWLWSDTFSGEYRWAASFSTYTGDERALSDEDKKLLKQREQWPPTNDEIIRLIMSEIQNKAHCGINDYFRRFI